MLNSIIAHIDMDCFFCSCEIKRNEEFKGKPVIVGGLNFRSVVSAANYEARKFNVHSALPISTAKRLCPEGIFLPVDMAYYKLESKKIMDLLKTITNEIHQVSVDEAYLDLTEYFKKFSDLNEMAKFIQKKIKDETKLDCSIGISESKIVSKIASDYNKPKGVTVVLDQKEFLKNLPINKIPGIGKVSLKYYIEKGIKTIGDLVNKDKFWILDNFGMSGINFQNIAKGLDKSKLEKKEIIKSISRETTLIEDTFDKKILENELVELINKVYEDLKNRYFKTLSIKIRYSNFNTITRDITLKTPVNSKKIIIENTLKLFNVSYSSQNKKITNTKNNYTNNYNSISNNVTKNFNIVNDDNTTNSGYNKIRLLGIKLSNLMNEKEIQTNLLDFF
ncbi:MAG: DNA polymerase IV [Candidatus Woesearchaeota archaeon]